MGNCGLVVKDEKFDNIISGLGINGSPQSRRSEKRRLTQNVVKENVDEDIEDFYTIHEQMILGSGMNGNVVQCVHKATNISYALKRISKTGIEPNRLMQIRDELNVMAFLDHPNIIRIHEVFEDENRLCLVLELCRGGHLMDRLTNQRGQFYRENIACKYVHSILTVVAYCHANNVVHRDLKLENILFETESKDSELKLIDFGLSRCFAPNSKMYTKCGTTEYVAPEVLTGAYDAKCDVWSVGVIAFILLSGAPPFQGDTDGELFAAIKAAQVQFNDNLLNAVSDAAKEFIRKCLNRRVSKRLSAAEALKDPWFHQLKPQLEGPPSPLLLQRFSNYIVRSWLAKIFIDVLSHTLLSVNIVDLRDQFNRFDTSETGDITLSDLRKFVAQSPGGHEEHISFLLMNLDIDQTGKISYHEFLAATINRKHFSEMNLLLAFETIAQNRVSISSGDIKRLLGTTKYDIDQIMAEVGLSAESSIDFDTFKSILNGHGHADLNSSFLNKYEDL